MKVIKISFLIICLLLFFSCGKKDGKESSSQKNINGSSKKVVETPKYGGEVSIFTRSSFEILDPIEAVDSESLKITANIFDTLVIYSDEKGTVEPGLAESWELSDSGLEWTFKIREGVKFHDGEELSAESIKFNFERWADPKNSYNKESFYYWKWMFGGAPGILKSVEVIDKYRVKVRLKIKFAPFLTILSMANFGISSPAAVEKSGADYSKQPVGTGPFKFDKQDKSDEVVLSENSSYWRGRPYLDRVIFKKLPNITLLKTEILANNITIADGLPDMVMKEVTKSGYPTVKLEAPTMDISYIAMNTMKTPFNNETVRKAIMFAINREEMLKTAYDGKGAVLRGIVPERILDNGTTETENQYDIERAKKLLKKIGYNSTQELKIWIVDSARPYLTRPRIAADMLKNSLEQIGITSVVEELDLKSFISRTQAGEHEIAIFGWRGDYPDSDNYFYPMLSIENSNLGSSGNFSFYKNEEIEGLIQKGRRTFESEKRKEIYLKLEKSIRDKALLIPLINREREIVVNRSLRGYIPSIFGYESLFKAWKKD